MLRVQVNQFISLDGGYLAIWKPHNSVGTKDETLFLNYSKEGGQMAVLIRI